MFARALAKKGWIVLLPDTYATTTPNDAKGTLWEINGAVTDSSFRTTQEIKLDKLEEFLARKSNATFLLAGLEHRNDKDHPLCSALPINAVYYCVDTDPEFLYPNTRLGDLLTNPDTQDSAHLQIDEYPSFFNQLRSTLPARPRLPLKQAVLKQTK